MNKAIALFLLTLSTTTSFAQDGEPQVSAATKRYHEYRYENTEPTYGLGKVKAAIKKIKRNPKDEEDQSLPTPIFNALSTKEKFTLCMIHGEVASQNCDGMPWIVGEEKKIFAQPVGFFNDEEMWSDRQTKFLQTHRGEVIGMLRETMRKKSRVGANLKAAISAVHANELIPDLVKVYRKDRKDQDILTLLMVLMKDGQYKPFLASPSYRKLYGKDANYQSFVEANPANQKLTIDRAMAFYKTRVH